MTCAIVCTKQSKWVGKRAAHIFDGGWVDAQFEGSGKDEPKSCVDFF